MKHLFLTFFLFISVLNSFGQEIEKITLEYKPPYGIIGFIRIELTNNHNNCHISNITLQKNQIVDFFKNSKKMPPSNVIDCNSLESLHNLINDFEKNTPNKLLGLSDIQDPRQFNLELVTDNGIREYESNIGQSFKTKDIDLKRFNAIVKEILTLAGYKWRKIL